MEQAGDNAALRPGARARVEQKWLWNDYLLVLCSNLGQSKALSTWRGEVWRQQGRTQVESLSCVQAQGGSV